MERHIGLWRDENDDTPEVAELIIDGNHIEFYRRNTNSVLPNAYIGTDDDHSYKVFTNGFNEYGKYRTLNNVSSCNTVFVLQQNCKYKNGLDIDGITEASFVIPELIDWLGIKTVDWGVTEDHSIIAVENKLQNIILKDANPKIEIYFEAKLPFLELHNDERTMISIDNQPRIKITYEEAVDVYILNDDIRCIMQFFALMIGHISNALDIRLNIYNQELKSWLYINEDFSYNLRTMGTIEKPRTKQKNISDNLPFYFENWYGFYYNTTFDLIRKMYFAGNKRKEICAEDIFVQYVRILEGYHLRITHEEDVANTIQQEIKNAINTDEGKTVFNQIFKSANWKINTKHINDVANWISSGFLSRTTLAQKLRSLDKDFFNIIAKNSKYIEQLENTQNENDREKEFDYYQRIVDTRNYYSHYKLDDKNTLNFSQMCTTINVLKALIIMILYSHMGMTNDEARRIIIWDAELHFQTMYLRKDGEKPENS